MTLLGILPNSVGMQKHPGKQVWVRMPVALCKRVEAMAQTEDRTFSSMMRVLTEEALNAREGGKK